MIHRFSHKGRYIVMDIASGGVYALDPLAYALCGELEPPLAPHCPETLANKLEETHSRQEIDEAYGELYSLYTQGGIFSQETPLSPALIKGGTMPVKALCLHVSHDCNLRCTYCFAQTGDFGTVRSLMTPDMARKAIDFVVAQSGGRRNIEVDFFGGEPLMAWDTVKATVEYARSIEAKTGKVFRFTMTTNGMLLSDEVIEYLNAEMSNVVLSVDGREQIHDDMRPTPTGTGSYRHIIPRFKKLVEGRDGKSYYMRGTYTARNLDFKEDILSIYNEGFREISVEPVSAPEGCGYELTEEHLPRIAQEYWALADHMAEEGANGFNFFHFNVDLTQGPCLIKRLRGCGAGCEYLAVTPEGDLYPCHQFVGQEDFCMGNLERGDYDKNRAEAFATVNVYTRDACKDCWARFYCSGGCSAANYFSHGNIDQCYEIGCQLERMRLECAIYLAVLRAEKEERERL